MWPTDQRWAAEIRSGRIQARPLIRRSTVLAPSSSSRWTGARGKPRKHARLEWLTQVSRGTRERASGGCGRSRLSKRGHERTWLPPARQATETTPTTPAPVTARPRWLSGTCKRKRMPKRWLSGRRTSWSKNIETRGSGMKVSMHASTRLRAFVLRRS